MRVLTTVLTLAATTVYAEDSAATQVVRTLNGALLQLLEQSASLDFKARSEKIAPAVDAAYDLPFMAEKSLGSHWAGLNDADKQRWLALSRRFSIANYAANFDHWSHQTIDVLGEEPAGNDTVVVSTKINDPKGESYEMSYRLRQTPDAWRIVDVYLKGTVSELALRRSDYTAVIEKGGFEELVKTMEGKLADFATGKAKR